MKLLLGILLNLLVVLANGGMPAATSEELIPDDLKPHYRAIDASTRLRWLADWIPIGNRLFSPGDLFVDAGAVGLVAFGLFKTLA